MATKVLRNLLSEDDIRFLLDNSDVISSKRKLSSQSKVDLSIHLPDSLKKKLEDGLNISLSDTVPLRWIKGNTTAHTDKGQSHFNRTHIVYLTNSTGSLVIDNQTYGMNAGDGYVFNEGLVHYTINSETSERLMIGPMSESGFGVGGSSSINTFTGDASDFTRTLKRRRLFQDFQGTRSKDGSTTPYNNPFNTPVDYRIVQSNQNRLSYNFGGLVCGCAGAFPRAPLGE